MAQSFLPVVVAAALVAAGCGREPVDLKHGRMLPGNAASAPQGATPWLEIMRRPGLQVTLDTTRISPSDSGYQVWVGSAFASVQHLPGEPNMQYKGNVIHVELNCDAARVRLLRVIVIGPMQDTVADHLIMSPWQPLDADPFDPESLTAVCRVLHSGSRD